MFFKTAQIQVLAYASDDTKKFVKTAQHNNTHSYYESNANQIDIQAMLNDVSDSYNISRNPNDYFFEAIRAVTAGVSNENGDAFSKNELLRFNHKLAKKVYQTFIMKPHQINHRADNPKTARGVIIDAHYNTDTPPLQVCPNKKCGAATAGADARDPETGLYCKKCGSTVKDEFVELLIAIDKKKDAAFAEGVKSGALNAGSMGCFVPGTQITLADGRTKSIELVVPGDEVITHNGNIAIVEDTSIHEHDGVVHSISVVGLANPIVATEEHSFWVVNPESGEGKWIPAKDLTAGQYLLTPKIKYTSDTDVDNNFARLAGYFVSEGNFIKSYSGKNAGKRIGIELTFNINEKEYVNEVQGLLSDMGYDAHIHERENRNTATVKVSNCVELATRLFNMFGEHAHSKFLPPDIYGWNREAQLNFIGAYINGDGCNIETKGHSWTNITTVSRDMADQLSQLLVNIGIPNRISVRKDTSGFGSPRPALDVKVTGDHQIIFKKYSNKIKRQTKNTVIMNKVSDNGILRKITGNTTSAYTGNVYNFGVNIDDHSYVANGIAVHNCECESTVCNVCNKRAYSRQQFCDHIKRGKKKPFKTEFGEKIAFEWCEGVVFTEYSRVHHPADPKAKQREVFTIAASIANNIKDGKDVKAMFDDLNKKVAELQTILAQMQNPELGSTPGAEPQNQNVPAPPPENKKDVAGEPNQEALDALNSIKDTHPEEYATLLKVIDPNSPDNGTPLSIEQLAQDTRNDNNKPATPEAMGVDTSVEESAQSMSGGGNSVVAEKRSAEANISVESNTDNIRNEVFVMSDFPFAGNYADIVADFTRVGNIKVANKHGDVFVIRPNPKPTDNKSRAAMLENVLFDICDIGLFRTAKKYAATFSTKTASILDHGIYDNVVGRSGGDKGGIEENGGTDNAGKRGTPPNKLTKDDIVDNQMGHPGKETSITDSPIVDHQEGITDGTPTHLTDENPSDMRLKRDKANLSDRTTNDVETDHQMKQAQASTPPPSATTPPPAPPAASGPGAVAAGMEKECAKHKKMNCESCRSASMDKKCEKHGKMKCVECFDKKGQREEILYKNRYQDLKKDFDAKIAESVNKKVAEELSKFKSCLRLACARQKLNLERSPIKIAMGDVLVTPMQINAKDQYVGLDQELTTMIVEASASVGFDPFINGLIARATELMKHDANALKLLEADVAAMIPTPIGIQASADGEIDNGDDNMRQAASEGNLPIAPSSTPEQTTGGTKRDSIRAALGQNRIGSHVAATKKKLFNA